MCVYFILKNQDLLNLSFQMTNKNFATKNVWLDLGKDIWRIIFYYLVKDRKTSICIWDICTLKATCRFMRDASLMRLGNVKWGFRYSPKGKTQSYVRSNIIAPPIKYKEDTCCQNTKKYHPPKGIPVFKKQTPNKIQPMFSVSWREPNKRDKQKYKKNPQRGKYQNKERRKQDWRRSGIGDYLYDWSSYNRIDLYYCVEDTMKNKPWAVHRDIIKDIEDSDGAITGRKISAREWYDPATGVIYYTQSYEKPQKYYFGIHIDY